MSKIGSLKLLMIMSLSSLTVACSTQSIDKPTSVSFKDKKDKMDSDEVSFKFSAVRSYQSQLMPMWFKNLDPDHQSGNLPIALNSPLIHKGLIFIGKNDGHMKAFEAQTGRLIWEKFDKGDYHSAPVAFGKNIIYGTGEGRIYARHYMTGKIKYAVDLDASVESRPVIYKGMIFVHLRNHKLFCLDARTGKIIWAYKRSVPYLTTLQRVSTPLVKRNKVYVGFADGYIASFAAEDGVLLWEKKIASGSKFVDVDVTPVIRGKTLFVNSLTNQLSLLDSATGALQRRMPYTPSRAPLFTNKGIILGTIHGELVSLDKHYQELKKIKVSDGPISSIVPWKDYYIVTSASQLLKVVHKRTFKVTETFDLGHVSSAVFGEVASKDGMMAFMSSRSRLYVFK
ncbi:MAG: PQQ-binding-like beta-propeller repeat protein [Bacteriovoracaceae bacterium]|jgi:outer membrane protein assembly factor BamB|nr:PQQ-binding-like beta-propeller repeat protein [Bacteriovoracaceae bacterium]